MNSKNKLTAPDSILNRLLFIREQQLLNNVIANHEEINLSLQLHRQVSIDSDSSGVSDGSVGSPELSSLSPGQRSNCIAYQIPQSQFNWKNNGKESSHDINIRKDLIEDRQQTVENGASAYDYNNDHNKDDKIPLDLVRYRNNFQDRGWRQNVQSVKVETELEEDRDEIDSPVNHSYFPPPNCDDVMTPSFAAHLAATAMLQRSPFNLSLPPNILQSNSQTQEKPQPPSHTSLLVRALATSSPRRQRGEKKPIPDTQKDGKYFERRKRNNLAAKKSRDSRKIREDQIALRASHLEQQNAILRAQVATLREEASSLRQLLIQKRVKQIQS